MKKNRKQQHRSVKPKVGYLVNKIVKSLVDIKGRKKKTELQSIGI